jgi:NAD(P)H dehydrogenase (quinone)
MNMHKLIYPAGDGRINYITRNDIARVWIFNNSNDTSSNIISSNIINTTITSWINQFMHYITRNDIARGVIAIIKNPDTWGKRYLLSGYSYDMKVSLMKRVHI